MSNNPDTSYPTLPVADTVPAGQARVCIASPDISGPIKNGGIGTAYKALAMALARGGHDVTILYPHGRHSEDGPISHWIEFYASHGIRFVPLFLPTDTALEGTRAMKLSYAVFDYFYTQTTAYDVIHFPEWLALGYYTLCAKQQGLILQKSTIVVGLHSPHLWNMRHNNEPVMDTDVLTLDFMERRCAAMADVVVSPSAYMIHWCRGQGWEFPANTHVQPYVLPESEGTANISRISQQAIKEIVFFGRLDTRKGLQLFCDALDQSAIRHRTDIQVTFLGRSVEINGLRSTEIIGRRSRTWQSPVKLITDLGRDAAVKYLREPGRLAVIASLADNSPNTVYECISNGIAFVALRTGGIPEVIASEDLPHVCCQANSAALARHLEQALARPPVLARPAMNFAVNEKTWNQWHASFGAAKPSDVITHTDAGHHSGAITDKPATLVGVYAAATDASSRGGCTEQSPIISVCLVQQSDIHQTRWAINSLKMQDYSPLRVVVALREDFEKEEDGAGRQLLADVTAMGWRMIYFNSINKQSAYDLAATSTDSKLLALMDDSVCLAPNAISLFAQAMAAGGADLLTSSARVADTTSQANFNTTPDRIRLFAAAPSAGLFENVFGGNMVLISRKAYDSLGGFVSPAYDGHCVGNDDAWWLFYARAALSACNMQCVPLPLLQFIRDTQATKSGNVPIDYALADIYRQHANPELFSLLLFAQAIKRKADIALPHWNGTGPIRLGLQREMMETIKDLRRKTRRIRYLFKGKPPPRN